MKIAIIQTQLFWENPLENRKYFEQKINSISDNVDLIVLPEMFTSGFTMNPNKVAETMSGETIELIKLLAKTKNCAITGSLVILENDNYYNRMIFIFPDGNIEFYDKKNLFTLAGENKVYSPGNIRKIIEYKGFRFCLQICYDLRFPVFSRNNNDYDALIYVANWPKTRINAWNVLLKARAVENMSFVIGVNRIGTDNNNLEYSGESKIIDYLGNNLIDATNVDGVFIEKINKNETIATRNKFGFLNDRDGFEML